MPKHPQLRFPKQKIKSLGVRRPVTFMTPSKFRKPGTGSPEPAPTGGDFEIEQGEGEDGDQAEPTAPVDEKPFEPLVLWEAGPGEDDNRISVDPRLCKWLRPHQREGVQFMFECGERRSDHRTGTFETLCSATNF